MLSLRPLIGIPCGITLLILACALAPSQVHAQCGDYVTYGHSATQEQPATPLQEKCHGPHCGKPQAPTHAPPLVEIRISLEDWALPSVIESPTLIRSSFQLLDELLQPSQQSSSIFHPPR